MYWLFFAASRPRRQRGAILAHYMNRAYQMVVVEVSAIRWGLTTSQRAIQRDIIQSHALGGKAPLEAAPDFCPREGVDLARRVNGTLDVIDDEPGNSILD